MRKKKKYVPRSHGIGLIQKIFRMKSTVTYDERVDIAEKAYGYLDEMKQKPSMQALIDIVDILNVLFMFIGETDTPGKCKKWRAVNCHEWLWERGHDDVIQTINNAHEALIKAEERSAKTGSLALDGDTYNLLEKCFTWYQELYVTLPRQFCLACAKACVGVHKKEKEGYRIVHMMFHPEYIEKEDSWMDKQTIINNELRPYELLRA